jgi:hypothetical protein
MGNTKAPTPPVWVGRVHLALLLHHLTESESSEAIGRCSCRCESGDSRCGDWSGCGLGLKGGGDI